jgi:hypothetical protein
MVPLNLLLEAIGGFKKTIELARKLFPAGFSKAIMDRPVH